MLRSLRSRIALATVAAAALVVGIVGLLVVTGFADSQLDALNARLLDRAERVLPEPGESVELPPPGVRVDDPVQRALEETGDVIRLVRGGRVVGARGDLVGQLGLPVDTPIGYSTARVDGELWRIRTDPLPLRFELPGFGQRLQVAARLAPVEAAIADLRRRVVTLGIAALIAAAIAGWVFGGVALRSLARLREAATRVSSTRDLSVRVPQGAGPAEVDELAGSLNAMLERLERSSGETLVALEATRRFAGDAGHELRNPLTAIGANLETLQRNPDLPAEQRRQVLTEAVADHGYVVDLLGALQSLARGEAVRSGELEAVDVAEIVDAAADAARRRHPGAAVELADGSGARVVAWPQGIRLMLDNLLENAIGHGGSPVRVLTRPCDDGGALLEVHDGGPGVPDDERARIFERFTRGAHAAREGSGLGLAIVAQQVALHGAEVGVDDSDLGGACFRVRFRERPPEGGQ